MARLRAGDELAWEILMAKAGSELADAILWELRDIGLPIALRDEILRETWRTARHTIGLFEDRDDDSLVAWLITMALSHLQTYGQIVSAAREVETAPAPVVGDAGWIKRLQAGDELAWEIMIARFAPDLRVAIARMLGRRNLPVELSDDIEQETWRTAVRKIRTFDFQGVDRLQHWLQSIARRHVQACQRRQQRRPLTLEDIEAQNLANDFALDLFMFANGLIEPSAEDAVLLIEELAILDEALCGLKPRDRDIFVAALLDHTSRGELAAEHQLEEDSISMILWRAKKRLRDLLRGRMDLPMDSDD
jgi:RNA polymerase sigma factor (sigma-70 family)